MKACFALVQLGHDLTLLVPEFDRDLRPSIFKSITVFQIFFPSNG